MSEFYGVIHKVTLLSEYNLTRYLASHQLLYNKFLSSLRKGIVRLNLYELVSFLTLINILTLLTHNYTDQVKTV